MSNIETKLQELQSQFNELTAEESRLVEVIKTAQKQLANVRKEGTRLQGAFQMLKNMQKEEKEAKKPKEKQK